MVHTLLLCRDLFVVYVTTNFSQPPLLNPLFSPPFFSTPSSQSPHPLPLLPPACCHHHHQVLWGPVHAPFLVQAKDDMTRLLQVMAAAHYHTTTTPTILPDLIHSTVTVTLYYRWLLRTWLIKSVV